MCLCFVFMCLYTQSFNLNILVFCFWQPGRGRGGVPPPSLGGPRGAPGAAARGPRGPRGPRGGPPRGRGAPPSRGQQPPMARGGKRKAGPEAATAASQQKKRKNDWGAQPIAQQPLGQSGYGSSYGGASDSQWYQDSYGQNW